MIVSVEASHGRKRNRQIGMVIESDGDRDCDEAEAVGLGMVESLVERGERI